MDWVIYILKCSDNTLYTGVTNNLDARIAKHEGGTGAKYTKGRGPFEVLYTEHYETRGDSLKREAQIKSLSRAEKLALVK